MVHSFMVHSIAIRACMVDRGCAFALRDRMSHSAVTRRFLFALCLRPYRVGRRSMSCVVLRECGTGSAECHGHYGKSSLHLPDPTRGSSVSWALGATVTIWNMPECM
jgi:hypothetical protein